MANVLFDIMLDLVVIRSGSLGRLAIGIVVAIVAYRFGTRHDRRPAKWAAAGFIAPLPTIVALLMIGRPRA